MTRPGSGSSKGQPSPPMSVHSSLQGQGIESWFIVLTSIKDTWGLPAVEKPKLLNNNSLCPNEIHFRNNFNHTNITQADRVAKDYSGDSLIPDCRPDPPGRKCGKTYPHAR